FQAGDGIRLFHVTGVQTCALPICLHKLLGKAETSCESELIADLVEGDHLAQFAHGLFRLRHALQVKTDDQSLAHMGHLTSARLENSTACSISVLQTLAMALRSRSSTKSPFSSKASAPRGTEHCGVIT